MEWTPMVWLGAYHGINPGMGWLFAVALAMQAGDVRGAWRALAPIALGHALAIGLALLAAWLLQQLIPLDALRLVIAGCLVGMGTYRLWRHRHPTFGGMRVGAVDLTAWSFLMATAHGAGLMVLPFVMPAPTHVIAAEHVHAMHLASSAAVPLDAVTALAVHTGAYLLTAGAIAHVVYRRLGLRLLRTAWFNMDWLWAGALVLAGLVVLAK